MRPYPPLLYGGGLLLALIGHLVQPLGLLGAWWARGLGVALMIGSGALALAAEHRFRAARTPVLPFRDATALVTSGPFSVSRNPIYLAFTVAVLGIALTAASWWPLITLPLALLAITAVIRGEEERLQRIFGDAYADYRRRVRRWL
ncbi:methyltransferase family protein [Pseudactinotalea terrae]|uniref:methyltransferase family protein n=1 Tax=Pseudactinotalea terrae TaxID=1743262 RepID=UPI0012E268F0|nr:isoprenylcysteine carboxylmethyltransferase family protein [Pseudactinotalea terrae]